MNVYLLPLGGKRFELYSESPDEPDAPPDQQAGRLRRWAHAALLRWNALVDLSRRGTASGRLGRWRDQVVCRLAETIAEQRTLWTLGHETEATLLFPTTMGESTARAVLDRELVTARRHHGVWLAIDTVLFIASAVLALVPGPNIVAYYLAFRVVGHFLSWRGSHYGIKRIVWSMLGDPKLAELATLVHTPRDARAARVRAIADELNLHRLSAFFQRVAA